MKRHFLWIPSALIAASLVFVACGDDDDSTGDMEGANGEPTEAMDSDDMDSGNDDTATDDMDSGSDDMDSGDGADDMGSGEDDMGSGNGAMGSTVSLEAVNGSGMSGEATLAESGEGVDVTVMIDDSMATGTAGVHSGTCDSFESTAIAEIGELEAGMAGGTVDIAMSEMTGMSHVIVVVDDSGEPVLCGEIAA